jgi:hypothetical protein
MIDYNVTMLDPIYNINGVPAIMRIDDWGEDIHVTAYSKTSGVELSISGNPDLLTVVPAAAVRVAELTAAGITRKDIDTGTIEMVGAIWNIEDTLPKPTPNGECDGELWLILSEITGD